MLRPFASLLDGTFLSADGQGGSGGDDDDPPGSGPAKASQPSRPVPAQPGSPSVKRPQGQVSGSHVNSGPTHHSNTAGHANFSKTVDPSIRIQEGVLPAFLKPGAGGSHVNSGPTHHENTAGHANFSKIGHEGIKTLPPELQIDRTLQPGPARAPAPAVHSRLQAQVSGSHVNSGPTHHSNTAGHANFSKTLDPSIRIQEGVLPEFLKPGAGGSHVNSGPTHHENTAGHANFSKVGHEGIKTLPPQLKGPSTR